MSVPTRKEQFASLFPETPAYRLDQIQRALFSVTAKAWNDVSALPTEIRERLSKDVPWLSYKETFVLNNKSRDTFKAMLTLVDGSKIETVLMNNSRDQWTICVSSQVGCAMRCTFCATGKMGFMRNLTEDEIVDQYRFWTAFLADNPDLSARISNIVFMGMGEPLANYTNLKKVLHSFLTYTDIGSTHITVSTVGLLPRLNDILNDAEWPPVRIAISLHSADRETRKKIVPTSYDDFLPSIQDWSVRYLSKFGNRRHHLTFEYVMLENVNDTTMHAEKLAAFAIAAGHVKINLIPYNFTGMEFQRSADDRIAKFLQILEHHSVTATRRRTMGDDIAAACGQLITEKTA
jgi:adenine C2-methylase RlmN of 23S rRNA A2503 and tRNA A37